jgi:hypothetical protein
VIGPPRSVREPEKKTRHRRRAAGHNGTWFLGYEPVKMLETIRSCVELYFATGELERDAHGGLITGA